jgi:hypothetical protein
LTFSGGNSKSPWDEVLKLERRRGSGWRRMGVFLVIGERERQRGKVVGL